MLKWLENLFKTKMKLKVVCPDDNTEREIYVTVNPGEPLEKAIEKAVREEFGDK